MDKRRIIFDLNGTLFEGLDYESRVKIILLEAGKKFDNEAIKGMLKAMKSYEDYYDHYTLEDYSRHLSEGSNLNLDEMFIKYFLSRADILAPKKMDPDILDILDYLHMRYDLAVLTNYFSYAQYDQMAYLGIDSYFSEVIGGERIIKPNREAFLRACGPFQPSECVMIGDDIKMDIEGAKSVPMDAIHYNKDGTINSREEVKDIKYLKYIL